MQCVEMSLGNELEVTFPVTSNGTWTQTLEGEAHNW